MRRGKPHPAITEYRLCKEFGWTKEELDHQPARFVEACIIIMNEIDRQTQEEIRKAERQSRVR